MIVVECLSVKGWPELALLGPAKLGWAKVLTWFAPKDRVAPAPRLWPSRLLRASVPEETGHPRGRSAPHAAAPCAAAPSISRWDVREDGERAPVSRHAIAVADMLLAVAEPGHPVQFPDRAWEAFAARCEVGAEVLDAGPPEGQEDDQYRLVVQLVGRVSLGSAA
jgi:hypothetical protein